jgi:hypothetical protein
MTKKDDLERAPRPMLISHEDMEQHIRAGRALRWTRPVAGRGFMAAKFDGTWFVVLRDVDAYQRAPEELAIGLETWQSQLEQADRKMDEVKEREPRRPESSVDVGGGARRS